MNEYELSDELFTRAIVAAGDPVPDDAPYVEYDSVRPKFDSVAAMIMHGWSLDSSHDEESGESGLGNGWHALFRSEHAILHADDFGFVSAWRVQDETNIEAAWEAIEKAAVYSE